jgi:DNA (cytosine-5)-methyltransferase 1
MAAYYNEIDPYCARWLRALIADGQIADGEVDERSIEEVTANDLRGFAQCHFFAGIGIWSLALRSAGWSDDRVVWTGSCPCQPFSQAGKGDEFADERHLWPTWFRLIKEQERRPVVIFSEQVASPTALGWADRVFSDLEGEGYTIGAVDTCAAGFGAPFIGQRLYFVAEAERDEQSRHEPCQRAPGRVGRVEQSIPWDCYWPHALTWFRALGNGNPRCVAATDAVRNALCAPQAEAFVRAYLNA